MSTQQRVLIVGGSGFLGRRITEALARVGHHVTVLTRGHLPVPSRGTGDVAAISADRRDVDGLRSALGGRTFDVVVDNIAFNGDDVRTLLSALDGANGTAQYVMVSSTAVYADRYTRRPIREADADLTVRLPVDGPNPFHPRLGHAYGNGKREAEQALRDSTVAWTAVRPPVILASDDRTRRVWWFVQRLLDGAPILIPEWGPGRVFQLTWTHDLGRAIGHIVANPLAYGKAYNVAQAEVYTAESWIEACAAQLDVTPRYVRVAEDCPPGYLLPVAGRPFGHMLLDTSSIRHDLGFDPSPEAVWLAETIQRCAAHPPAEPSPGYEHRAAEIAAAEAKS